MSLGRHRHMGGGSALPRLKVIQRSRPPPLPQGFQPPPAATPGARIAIPSPVVTLRVPAAGCFADTLRCVSDQYLTWGYADRLSACPRWRDCQL
jgi:hypothetical protein